MLRKINILAHVNDDQVLGEDLSIYDRISTSSSVEMLKHILFAGLAHHFQVQTPEIVYATDKDNKLNELYACQKQAIQSIEYWHLTQWTKIDLRYFLNPQKIIYNFLLRKYLLDMTPNWGWVIIKDTKDQWGWSPLSTTSATFEHQILHFWLPNFSTAEINETIDDFFGLVDYKVNDILVFTMASFVELWEDQKTLREEWSAFLLDESRIKQLKKEALYNILEYH